MSRKMFTCNGRTKGGVERAATAPYVGQGAQNAIDKKIKEGKEWKIFKEKLKENASCSSIL